MRIKRSVNALKKRRAIVGIREIKSKNPSNRRTFHSRENISLNN